MRIKNLIVKNFRAIRRVEMTDLGDMIMIAGPNGCGKSCILDSIRLLKSIYGGYSANEWQQWFTEFQIDFQRNPKQMVGLLRDRSRSSVIRASAHFGQSGQTCAPADCSIYRSPCSVRWQRTEVEQWRIFW